MMISRLAALALTCATLLSSGAQASGLDEILAKAAGGQKAPGAGLLVIQDFRVADQAVYGVRRLGDPRPVKPGDVWNIGSDAKAMTAVMVARLVERGVLSWDATLASLLPDMAAGMRPEYRTVTLQQLLAHTSGLPHDLKDDRALNELFYAESSATPQERRKAYVARSLQDAPAGPAGRFSYSNTGFLIAAMAAERATGATYEALMRDEVFKPLGMTSAGFGLTPESEPTGHIHGRVAVLRDVNPDFFAPAGNIYLSLEDWARFCIDQMKGANGQGALLRPQTYALMQTAASGAPVSMGWFLRGSVAGLSGPVLFHEGSDGAWFALVALSPKSGAGVLAVANGGKDMGGEALDMAAGLAAAKLLTTPK
jgi:CubicO group peptidase (beta-lactamase class C family)